MRAWKTDLGWWHLTVGRHAFGCKPGRYRWGVKRLPPGGLMGGCPALCFNYIHKAKRP